MLLLLLLLASLSILNAVSSDLKLVTYIQPTLSISSEYTLIFRRAWWMVPGPTLPTPATPALNTQWQLAQPRQWLAHQPILLLLLLLPAQMPLRQLFPLSQEVDR